MGNEWESLQRLRGPVAGKNADADILFCLSYQPQYIVALCSIEDRRLFFSADASREIAVACANQLNRRSSQNIQEIYPTTVGW